MMRALKWAARLVARNFGWKVLSLAIAIAIWTMVASEPEMNTFAPVQVEFKNLPDGLEIASEPVNTIELELRGPSGTLRDLGTGGVARPSVALDMTGVRPGQRTFSIGDGNVKLPRGLRLVRAIPSEVRFDFELSEKRLVPVSVRFAGEGKNGYVVARYEVSPKEVGIVGPSSRVARIAAAVTDPVDVSEAVGSGEFRVNAFVNDANVRFQTSSQVSVTVTMRKK
jgi:YbbR domain-containing protein